MQSVKTETILRAAISLLVAALVFVIYAGIHERVVVAGDTAPEFTITADNGRTVSVPGFGGKLLILNFWASWCPPCVQETPSLSQLAQTYAGKGVVVMGSASIRTKKPTALSCNASIPRFSQSATSRS